MSQVAERVVVGCYGWAGPKEARSEIIGVDCPLATDRDTIL